MWRHVERAERGKEREERQKTLTFLSLPRSVSLPLSFLPLHQLAELVFSQRRLQATTLALGGLAGMSSSFVSKFATSENVFHNKAGASVKVKNGGFMILKRC